MCRSYPGQWGPGVCTRRTGLLKGLVVNDSDSGIRGVEGSAVFRDGALGHYNLAPPVLLCLGKRCGVITFGRLPFVAQWSVICPSSGSVVDVVVGSTNAL